MKDNVGGASDTNVGSRSVDNAEATKVGVCGLDTKNSRSSVVDSIIPKTFDLAK